MDTVSALIVFSTVAAFICVKSRAAGPALLFGVVAVVLFCTTPTGDGLPSAVASLFDWIGDQGSPQLDAAGSEQ